MGVMGGTRSLDPRATCSSSVMDELYQPCVKCQDDGPPARVDGLPCLECDGVGKVCAECSGSVFSGSCVTPCVGVYTPLNKAGAKAENNRMWFAPEGPTRRGVSIATLP